MLSPDEVRDRPSFHDAVGALIRQPTVSREQHAAAVAEAELHGYVVQPHARATMYGWAKGALPQRSGGPFLDFLLSRGVAVDDLESWTEALERVRAMPLTASEQGGDDGAASSTSATASPPPVGLMPSAASPAGASASPLDDPAAGHASGTAGPDGQRKVRPRRWLVTATVAVLIVLGVSVAVFLYSGGTAGDGGSSLPSATEEPFLREDFDEPELASTKWDPPASPQHVYVAQRVLNLVGATDREPREIDVDLRPRNVPDFRQLDFVASVPELTRAGPGGASLTVTERSGRTHRLAFGPTPGNPPTRLAAALICSRPSCRSYDDYDTPPPTRPFEYFAGDEVVPMRVLQSNGVLTFSMRGQVMATAPLAEPLQSFAFNIYSDPDERWRVTVDAIRVYR